MSEQKTVRVRIAVAVDEGGDWASAGWRRQGGTTEQKYDDETQGCALEGVMGTHVAFHWIEADVPLPETKLIVVEPKLDRVERADA